MQGKKFLKKYAAIFVPIYIVGFIVLVTFFSRFKFPTIPGDILFKVGETVIYFPFASSLAIAIFATVMLEAYSIFKHA